jgi:starch synthase (maltosyl-transferring)
LNSIRRENPALQSDWSLRFHPVDNDQLLVFSKEKILDAKERNLILVAVNLDPYHVQSGWVTLPVADFGIPPHETYVVEDLLGGGTYRWQGGVRNYIELSPHTVPAHVFRVSRIPA